ncbi:hypothetical protein Pfo_027520 [Paulownia fortunei]|nr:hypothetical protein Pfo_027520 [Paulownia fortunei]
MGPREQTVLQFVPSATSVLARVHPLVIFNICDSYVRRPDQEERVIGTLLGSVLPDGTVDIRNCYALPHNGSGCPEYRCHHNMLSSHQKVNPKEVIVGWFPTGFGVTGGSALIHEFYSRELTNPVHLNVHTGFKNGETTIKAFVMNDALNPMNVDKLPRHVAPDCKIGRFISDTVASLPKLSPHALDKLVNDSLQDQLLLLYLSTITRTQLSLAEKFNMAAQIL